ncbi:hypothetical protein TNIN_437731 [Trichonephila inaurata madagascariensis]|uniref:Uncharacterized protein n=1 Tax=Trichonephila inaurata madagascariensis TaxID=2747483 RepID=A0A8X6WYL0_9ARAC|nr:hypothetical protein TNIN_437731 [Trichonephila inaurata madagascariensis]
MSNDNRLDNGMRWRIYGKQELVTSADDQCSPVSNLCNQFQDTRCIGRKPGLRFPMKIEDRYLVQNGDIRQDEFHRSKVSREMDVFRCLSLAYCRTQQSTFGMV